MCEGTNLFQRLNSTKIQIQNNGTQGIIYISVWAIIKRMTQITNNVY